MKLIYKLFSEIRIILAALFFLGTLPMVIQAQITLIPDSNFEQALIDLGIDSDGIINGQVLTSDIYTVQSLNIRYKNISNLSGIEDFAALENLDVRGNPLSSLNITENSNLKTLSCIATSLTSLDISQNLLLEELDLSAIHLMNNIDLSNNLQLEALILIDCWIHSLDISNNTKLKTLEAPGINISEIDLSNHILLEYLDVTGVHLESLDVSHNINLKELYCGNFGGDYGQVISEIDLSNNVNLEVFYAENLNKLERFNAKNGNNAILNVILSCEEHYGGSCDLPKLTCVQVDDEVSANNNEVPYYSWYIDADFIYSEDCLLGVTSAQTETFSLYPNPTQDNLIVTVPSTIGKVELQIFNMEGRLLMTQNIHLEKQFSIDVSNLANGLYFIKVTGNTEVLGTKKFIKR